MKQGNEGEIVGVFFFALPENLWLVREWIADGGEAAFEKLGKAFVLGLLGVGFEKVEARMGFSTENTLSTRAAPSPWTPERSRIRGARPFEASKPAWK